MQRLKCSWRPCHKQLYLLLRIHQAFIMRHLPLLMLIRAKTKPTDPDADVRSYTRFQVSFFLSGGIFGSAPQPTVQDTWDKIKIGGPTATGERLREIREELLRLSNAHLPRLPKERVKLLVERWRVLFGADQMNLSLCWSWQASWIFCSGELTPCLRGLTLRHYLLNTHPAREDIEVLLGWFTIQWDTQRESNTKKCYFLIFSTTPKWAFTEEF